MDGSWNCYRGPRSALRSRHTSAVGRAKGRFVCRCIKVTYTANTSVRTAWKHDPVTDVLLPRRLRLLQTAATCISVTFSTHQHIHYQYPLPERRNHSMQLRPKGHDYTLTRIGLNSFKNIFCCLTASFPHCKCLCLCCYHFGLFFIERRKLLKFTVLTLYYTVT